MTADELANAVIDSTERACISDGMDDRDITPIARSAVDAASRITGIGQEQYQVSPNEQRFESYSLSEVLTGLREELLDIINYAVMTDILVQRKLDWLANADPGAYINGVRVTDETPPSPESVACAIKDACVAATTETLAAMFPEGSRYGVEVEVEYTIDVDLYNLAFDFDADGVAVDTDTEACADDSDAPVKLDPLFGLTFTIDSLEREKGTSSHTARMACDGPVTHGSRNARIGFRVDHTWEAPVGEQYVLIPKSTWEAM